MWSVASRSLLSTCGEVDDEVDDTNYIQAVAAMPDGRRFLCGGPDIRVYLLDGTLKDAFTELHTNLILTLVPLPDNQHALSGACDGTAKLFNVNDGALLRTFFNHTVNNRVWSLALLPDGRRFVSGLQDSTAHILEHGLAPH